MHYNNCHLILICFLFVGCGSNGDSSIEENLAIRQVEAPKVYQGEYAWEEGEGSFVECRTGKRYPVGGGKADKELKRTLFSIDPGQATGALIEVEGFLAQQLEADSGWTGLVFMVEKLLDLDIQQTCSDVGIPITQDSLYIQIAQEMELLSQMYLDTPLQVSAISPDMPLSSIIRTESMQLGLWAFIMTRTGLSQRQMMERSDSLHTVWDVYELVERGK